VHVREGATVDQAVLLDNVTVGEGAHIRHCIIDKNVQIPAGFAIGHDVETDSEHFHISDKGVVAVPKGYKFKV
jgi:glucose-1-phosphate adenylyltransferase